MNYCVIGLMFGDEGKGTIVDFLARETKAGLVCRFNGGAQARHHVVHDGKEHGFSQFGSGTLAGVPTLLSKFVLVNPLAMQIEAQKLVELGLDEKKLWEGMFVDELCRITTPYHRALNRLRELCRGDARHGSCGMGIGETVSHFHEAPEECILAGDITQNPKLKSLLEATRKTCFRTLKALPGIEEVSKTPVGQKELSTFVVPTDLVLDGYKKWAQQAHVIKSECCLDMLRKGDTIFEGAQGVLLDEHYGFHPYTTWSSCTQINVLALTAEAKIPFLPTTIGVIRTYATRHGAGPFPTFNRMLTACLRDKHNGKDRYQGEFRVGWFDLPLMNYALECCKGGVECLAITNLDRIGDFKEEPLFCYEYENLKLTVPKCWDDQKALTKLVETAVPKYEKLEALGLAVMATSKIPIRIVSYGAESGQKRMSGNPLQDFINQRSEVQSFAA